MPTSIVPAADCQRLDSTHSTTNLDVPSNDLQNFPVLSFQNATGGSNGIIKTGFNPLWPREVEPAFSRFLDFPSEVRELIIEEYVLSSPNIDRVVAVRNHGLFGNHVRTASTLPAICLVSKQMLVEATPVYIRNSVFKLRGYASNCSFKAFLSRLAANKPFEWYASVRELHLTAFHWFQGTTIMGVGNHADLQLIKLCPGLRRVSLTFHVSKMTTHTPAEEIYDLKLKTTQEVLDYYDLAELLAAKSLREITFDSIKNDGISYRCIDGDPVERLEEVAEWVRERFARQGRDV